MISCGFQTCVVQLVIAMELEIYRSAYFLTVASQNSDQFLDSHSGMPILQVNQLAINLQY